MKAWKRLSGEVVGSLKVMAIMSRLNKHLTKSLRQSWTMLEVGSGQR